MKYLKLILLITLLLTVTIFSQPSYKINIHGGYTLLLPDLKGDPVDSTDQYNTLTMQKGYNAGIDFKYYPYKKQNIGFTLSVNYNMFSSSADTGRLYMDIGYALMKDIKYKLNSLSFGLGAEYSFSPKQKINPYAGLEITGSYFTGTKEFTNGGNKYKRNLSPALRFGFAVGAGADVMLGKSAAISAGAKYNLANLINKQNTFTGLNPGDYPLFDGEIEQFAAKNISYLQFNLGITFIINPGKTAK